MNKRKDFRKEEIFYFLIEHLISDYTENNYSEAIALEDLSRLSGLNKYTLLRNFTMQRGITPYQYLSTIRVNKAKKLLEAGVPSIDVAIQAGFADQSHFTRFFKNFIGLTPKQYQDIFNVDREQAGKGNI